MEIIDTQLHTAEHVPAAGRPYDTSYSLAGQTPDHYENEMALVAMDAVGVDAAVLSVNIAYRTLLPNGLYRHDNSYGEEAAVRWPGRFTSVARVEQRSDDVDEQVARVRDGAGVLGIRCSFTSEAAYGTLIDGEYDRMFTAAEKHDVPVFAAVPGHQEGLDRIAREHEGLTLIVDHFGLVAPPFYNDWLVKDPHPFHKLPNLLALAKYPKVAVKFGGVPRLSAERFPYADTWPYLHQVIDAFGADRCMFASDWTVCRDRGTYAEAVFYLRDTDELSAGEKEQILGASARRLLRWPKEPKE